MSYNIIIDFIDMITNEEKGDSLIYDVDIGNFNFVNIHIYKESNDDKLVFSIYKVIGIPITPETEETLMSNDHYISELDTESGSVGFVAIYRDDVHVVNGDIHIVHTVLKEIKKRIKEFI